MELSFKDIQFTIEAIDNLVSTYAIRLDRQDIDEDEAADLGNDRMFLQSLGHRLVSRRDRLPRRAAVPMSRFDLKSTARSIDCSDT